MSRTFPLARRGIGRDVEVNAIPFQTFVKVVESC
jgi:hypothetical protein